METGSEAALVHRAAEGDPTATRAVYDRHADRVWAVVRRMAGDPATAEDWAQEAWIRVFRALPGFRGDAALATWIHRIAVNCALDGRRRGARRDERPLPDTVPARGDRTGRVVDRIALERAIDALPDGMREVLVLHDVEGYTHEEIGAALGVAAGTSRSQLFKARARLRETLAARAPEHGRERCAT